MPVSTPIIPTDRQLRLHESLSSLDLAKYCSCRSIPFWFNPIAALDEIVARSALRSNYGDRQIHNAIVSLASLVERARVWSADDVWSSITRYWDKTAVKPPVDSDFYGQVALDFCLLMPDANVSVIQDWLSQPIREAASTSSPSKNARGNGLSLIPSLALFVKSVEGADTESATRILCDYLHSDEVAMVMDYGSASEMANRKGFHVQAQRRAGFTIVTGLVDLGSISNRGQRESLIRAFASLKFTVRPDMLSFLLRMIQDDWQDKLSQSEEDLLASSIGRSMIGAFYHPDVHWEVGTFFGDANAHLVDDARRVVKNAVRIAMGDSVEDEDSFAEAISEPIALEKALDLAIAGDHKRAAILLLKGLSMIRLDERGRLATARRQVMEMLCKPAPETKDDLDYIFQAWTLLGENNLCAGIRAQAVEAIEAGLTKHYLHVASIAMKMARWLPTVSGSLSMGDRHAISQFDLVASKVHALSMVRSPTEVDRYILAVKPSLEAKHNERVNEYVMCQIGEGGVLIDPKPGGTAIALHKKPGEDLSSFARLQDFLDGPGKS